MADCYTRVLEELNNKQKLDVDEKNLKKIVEHISNLRNTSEGDANLFGKKVAEFLGRVESVLATERKNTVLDKIKRERNKSYLLTYDKKQMASAIKATIAGSTAPKQGGNLSVENLQHTAFEMWASGFERDLTKKGLTEVFSSGSLDREISVALFNLKKTGDIDFSSVEVKALPKEAIEIAKSIRKAQNIVVEDLNMAGASIVELDGYIQRQIHDGNKILTAQRDVWKNDMINALDLKRTFGDLDQVGINKALDDLYDNFSNGFHEKFTEMSLSDTITKITRGGNLAEKIGRERSLHFKSGDAFYEYNTKYGRDTLAESLIRAFETNSRNYGLLEKFGSNPKAGFDKLVKDAYSLVKDDKEIAGALTGTISKTVRENLFNEVAGKNHVYTSNLLSKITSVATTASGISKLGFAAPRSLTDLSTAAAMITSTNGNTFLGTIADVTKGYFSLFPKENRQFWARELGFTLNTMKDSIINGAGIEAGPGYLSKINNIYYKTILLSQHTDAIKLATARILAVDVAENARLGWATLNDQSKLNFSRYNIGEGEFNVFAKAIKQVDADGSGSKLVTPDSLDELPLEAFKEARDINGTKVSLDRYKKDTIRNYSVYLQDIARHSTNEPGVAERNYLKWGFAADHPIGAVLKVLTQFKSFPLTSLRILSRISKSKGNGFDAKAVSQYITMSMGIAYMADSLIEASKGKEPKDPKEVATVVDMFQRSGAGGIYSDFLLMDYGNAGSAAKNFLGPSIGTTLDAASIFSKAIKGDAKAGTTFRFVLNNTPFLNTFYLRGALDYLILNDIQENLSPGFMEKQRNRLQKEGRSLLFEE